MYCCCFNRNEISGKYVINFNPPIEEIKAWYYQKLKSFTGIPNSFQGVSDDPDNLIFKTIIDRNPTGLLTCFQKANDLFQKLESVPDMFKVRDVL